MRGISLLSGVIFIAFTIVAVAVVYEAGMPVVDKMQAAAQIEKMKTTFAELDEMILEVASEGKGSKRTVYFKPDPGELVVNGTNDYVYWLFETTANVISPRTWQRMGNLIIGANLDTSAYEGTHGGNNAFILENEHLMVYVKKKGSSSNNVTINTSELLLAVYHKDLDKFMPLEKLEISIDDNETSTNGTGYTTLEASGYNLPYATVTAYMYTNYLDYNIKFTLDSGADFIIIEAGL